MLFYYLSLSRSEVFENNYIQSALIDYEVSISLSQYKFHSMLKWRKERKHEDDSNNQ